MEFERLQSVIAAVMNVDPEDITLDTSFEEDLGADSLSMAEILIGLEDEFDISFPEDVDIKSIVTVGDALEQLRTYL